MCSICDDWQGRNGQGAGSGSGPTATGTQPSGHSDGALVAHDPQSYVFLSSQWENVPGRTLTWSNATLRLARLQGGIETSLNESQLALVREAFTMWAAVANVKFREVADSDESDIRVGLGNIDGPGGTAGQAQSWTEGGFKFRSNIRFDTGNYPRSSTVSRQRFLRVALHEIGHALGLGHSPVTTAIMYALGNSTTTLQEDDIAGVRAIFGPSQTPLPNWPANETVNLGNLTNRTTILTQSGSVNRPRDEIDHFRFTLDDTRTVGFELRSLSGDAHLYLNDASGRYLAGSFRSGDALDTFVRELGSGTYYASVLTTYDRRGTSDYRLRVGIPREPTGGTRETAINLGDLTGLQSARTRSGAVNREGSLEQASNPNDYYRFTLTAAWTMRFELRDLSANANLYLENASGGWIQGSLLPGTSVDSIVRTLAAGSYYIRIGVWDSGNIRYRLRYRVQTTPDGQTRETAFSIGNLTNLTSSRTRSGTVNTQNNPSDYRRFTLTDTRTLRFELRNLSANADLYLGKRLRTMDPGLDGHWHLGGFDHPHPRGRDLLHPRRCPRHRQRPVPAPLPGSDHPRRTNPRDCVQHRQPRQRHLRPHPLGHRERGEQPHRLPPLHPDRNPHHAFRAPQPLGKRGPATRVRRGRVDSGLDACRHLGRDYRPHPQCRDLLHPRRCPRHRNRALPAPLPGAGHSRRMDPRDRVQHRQPDRRYVHTDTFGNRQHGEQPHRLPPLHPDRNPHHAFELRNLSANADLRLEYAAGGWIQGSTLAGTSDETIVRTLAAGTYFIRVDARETSAIRYQLRYRVQTTPDGWTRETAFNIGNLTSLSSARTRPGTVTAAGNRSDYRRFTLTDTRTVRFELRGLSGNADLYLEDEAGRSLQYSTMSGTSVDSIISTLDAGTWYIRVDGRDSSVVRYQLHYRLQRTSNGRPRETAVDLGDLTGLASTREQSDTVSYSGNYDNYYRFTLTGTRTLRFELRDLSADADLYVEDAFGRSLQRSTLSGTAVDSIVHSLDAGTYYVRVRAVVIRHHRISASLCARYRLEPPGGDAGRCPARLHSVSLARQCDGRRRTSAAGQESTPREHRGNPHRLTPDDRRAAPRCSTRQAQFSSRAQLELAHEIAACRNCFCSTDTPRPTRAHRVDEPTLQPLRQRQSGELHQDPQGRSGLSDRRRDVRGRQRRPAEVHRRGLLGGRGGEATCVPFATIGTIATIQVPVPP